MTSYLRPDEEATYSEIERNKGGLSKSIKTAANIGLTATGLGISSKIAPFLSPLIPKDLALKGISKLSPKLGDFLKKGLEQGLNLGDGLDFIKDNMGGKQNTPEPTKQNGNIIEQYDPELFTYIKDRIGKGIPILQAGEKAKDHPRFANAIKKLEKDHKTPWASILQSVFGGQGQEQPQQQGGQGQQALMAILQQVQQARGQR